MTEGRARTKGWSPTLGRAGMKAFGLSGSNGSITPTTSQLPSMTTKKLREEGRFIGRLA